MVSKQKPLKKGKLSPEDAKVYNRKRLQDRGKPLLDSLYNKVVNRYTRLGNKFEHSDAFVWQGSIYELPTLIGYIIFFGVFLFLAHLSFERYGDARTIVFVLLLMMWRMQTIIGLLASINKKF